MHYHHYAELIAFCVGVLLLRKNWPMPYKLMVALAGVSFVVELGAQILWDRYRYNNNWIYNLFIPIQHLVFFLFIRYSVVTPFFKKAVFLLIYGALLGTLVSYYWHRNFFMLNNIAHTLLFFGQLVAVCCYYLDVVSNNVKLGILHQPPFWLVTGLFFFCVVFVVRFSLWGYIKSLPDYRMVLKYTTVFSNTLLYGGFIFSFICLQKTKNSYLSISS